MLQIAAALVSVGVEGQDASWASLPPVLLDAWWNLFILSWIYSSPDKCIASPLLFNWNPVWGVRVEKPSLCAIVFKYFRQFKRKNNNQALL